jgi:hypothetical protein
MSSILKYSSLFLLLSSVSALSLHSSEIKKNRFGAMEVSEWVEDAIF